MQRNYPTRPPTLAYLAERRPAAWRTRAALCLAPASGLLAGFALSAAGFGFFPAWLFFTILCPLAACLVATSRHLLVAVLAAAAMMAVPLYRVLVPGNVPLGYPSDFRSHLLAVLSVLSLISVAIAAGIGAAFAAKARAARQTPSLDAVLARVREIREELNLPPPSKRSADWYAMKDAAHGRTLDHDCRLSSLPTDAERELAALWRLEADVNNGGYLQFIGNWGRETYAYASQALKKIGARRTAEIVDQCQALVDEHAAGDDLPAFPELRASLPENVVARIYDLSYEFMESPDDIEELGMRHYRPGEDA